MVSYRCRVQRRRYRSAILRPSRENVLLVVQRLTGFALREPPVYGGPSRNPNGGIAMVVVRVIAILLRAFLLPRAALDADDRQVPPADA
jgi:hypothetical protein